MSSFFTIPTSQRKRKRADDRAGKSTKRRATAKENGAHVASARPQRSESPDQGSSITGSQSEDSLRPEELSEAEATSEEDEDPADRRIRLAQRYLDNLRREVDETGFDAEDIDKDLISHRLKEDADEAKGRQYRRIANTLDFGRATHSVLRAEVESTTAVAICPPYAYTVSKDKSLIKWHLPDPSNTPGNTSTEVGATRRRPKQVQFVRGVRVDATAKQQHGHTRSILAVAASPDGRYIATGGHDKQLIIWSAASLKPLKTFTTHRDAITGLSFASTSSQPGAGSQLFSSSKDRTLKTYSLNGDDSLAYVETLFGHQDHVIAVAAMGVDQCVSVGARDRTARLWKVVEETQLVFRADSSRNESFQTGSVDCVAAVPPTHFVTGSDAGAISLWTVHKKKALFTIQMAHGVDEPEPFEKITSEADPLTIDELRKSDWRRPLPRAITALATIPGTDVLISGSWDGFVRAWKISDDKKSILTLGAIGAPIDEAGTANGLQESVNQDSSEQARLNRIPAVVKGVVNSLAVFERRKQIVNEFGGKKEGECQGLCVVAGTGKQMRLGSWRDFEHGKNGGVVLEVPLLETRTP